MNEKKLLLTDLPGVAKRRKDLLAKLEISTIEDLIMFFPRDYEDWTNPKSIADLIDGAVETFVATASQKPSLRRKGRMSILKTVLRDSSNAAISCTWFNQPYLEEKIMIGQQYLFHGKIKRNGISFEIVNPTFEIYSSEAKGKIKPLYRLTNGLTQGVMRQLILDASTKSNFLPPDPLSDEIRKQYKLCTVEFAYEKIHNPNSMEEFAIARRRLVFEELFMVQAGLRLIKSTIVRKTKAFIINPDNVKMQKFYDNLPFILTPSQNQVIKEIISDLAKKIPMNRLVQGDVGSGKTVISAAAIACCVFNGEQATLMAPTSVLANQHYKTIMMFFARTQTRIELLTGSVTGKKKIDILNRLKDGEIDILIGTHAILEESVVFHNLALAITDEQHRFGVKQRRILGKGSEFVPHVLVMSATPIPRTLGLILYGDLDISVLKGLPVNRKPIETYTAKSSDEKRIYSLIEKEISEGRQIYIVCPMIESSLESDLNSVNELYTTISNEIFPKLNVGLLHGAMNNKTKNEVMEKFMRNEINILVSTTVIEVGVDNPNASIMLIKNAERFGLAQLHQLRGRIGRGPYRSICILESDTETQTSHERLRIICKHIDGFEIAEKDLELRGIGDFFGTRQHGIPEMKIANLYRDTDILKETQAALEIIFTKDPLITLPENRNLLPSINKRFGEHFLNVGI